MKKRFFGILLALCMVLCLVPATASAADFTGWTALGSGNWNLGSGKYYLNSDISMSELLRTQENADVTIDLNGHVLTAEWGVRASAGSSLTIQDSAPTALHTDGNAQLPAGGVLRARHNTVDVGVLTADYTYRSAKLYLNGGTILQSTINVMSGSKLSVGDTAQIRGCKVDFRASSYDAATTLYANGGVIEGEVTGYGIIENTVSTVTSFYGSQNYNVKIRGGLFYGQSLDEVKEKDGTLVTYQSEGETYATQVLPVGRKAVEPDNPKKDGWIFTGWFQNDGTAFDFNTPVTEALTLTAGWFDPATAGGKGDKGDPGVTPQLRVNSETNEWEVSYDGGESWASLGVQATGDKGDTGETGATGAAGADGKDGQNGKDGVTPLFRVDPVQNLWEISYDGGESWTSYAQATGDRGEKGDPGADGKDGKDGLVPSIGENGNWWLGETDTGVKAFVKGDQGEKGEKGDRGSSGSDGENGKDGKDGVDGRDGRDGENGKDGRGIANAEINADGELVLTYTDKTTVNLGKVVGADGKDGLTPAIGENGNWWLGEADTGVKAIGGAAAAASAEETAPQNGDPLAAIAIAVAGLALAGDAALALALYAVAKKKKGE